MATEETTKTKKTKTCRCGHARGHHMVSADAEYTFVGWVALLLGISARPTRINYHCRRCDQIFERTTDPEVLANHY